MPTTEELSDAEINIQAFVFNVFASVDKLAWIWVSEKDLTKDDGTQIPRTWVGLRKKNEGVRESFSPVFLEYLEGLDAWFGLIENFRDALAHRIPLYIPPYLVPDGKLAAYEELGDRMAEAFKRGQLAEHERLSSEQEALVVFEPYMTHSFEEKAKPVVLHAQMLADFNTIEELGQRMLEELDR